MKHFQNHGRIEVALLLSNNPEAGALLRASDFDVPTKVFDKTQFREGDEVVQWLKEAGVTHIVLAGFLWLVPQNILHVFPGRIINIHPSLLPLFGGKGMYGSKVHDAVIAAGVKETGITIHEVNDHFDEGRILFQTAFAVNENASAEEIAQKIHKLEHAHYPSVIEDWILKTG